LPSDDPQKRQPDITLAKAELGWQPQVTLKEGLTKTISYFEKLLGSPSREEKYIKIVKRERRQSVQDRRIANTGTSASGSRDRRSGTCDRRRAASNNDPLHTVAVAE
jgi:hypothetical protein